MHYFVKIGWLLWDTINYMLIFLTIIGLLFGASCRAFENFIIEKEQQV